MSANIKIVNWQGIAQSNFTWVGDLWYPTSDQAYKIWLGNRFSMTGTWPVDFASSDPGYNSYINPYIRIRFWNQVGSLVYDSGKWPCWLINGQSYEFDMVSHVLTEVSQGSYIYSKVLTHDSAMDSIPVSTAVVLNSPGYIHIVAGNDGQINELMYLSYVVSRPDGSTAQSFADQSTYVEPGGFYTFGGSQFSLDAAGTWVIDIILYVWDGSQWVQVDQWSGNLCTVTGGGNKAATLFSYSYWHDGMSDWAELLGTENFAQGIGLYLLVSWVNTGSVALYGHVDLSITKPDGTVEVLEGRDNQDRLAQPGNGWQVVFAPASLNQVGNYSVLVTLKETGETTILDQDNFNIRVVAIGEHTFSSLNVTYNKI